MVAAETIEGLRIIDVCAGGGMLGEGVKAAVEGSRVVGFVERQAHSAAVLLARMEESSIPPAPVWCGDLRRFDATAWRGAVDCLVAGFPCQPWSVAGLQRGVDDERWLLPDILDLAVAARAPLVALENVRGVDIAAVCGELDGRGYVVAWDALEALAVGAAHHRHRVFFLAYRADYDCAGQPRQRVCRILDRIRSTQWDDADGRRGQADGTDSGAIHSEQERVRGGFGEIQGADANSGGQQPCESDVRQGQSDPERRRDRAIAGGEGLQRPGGTESTGAQLAGVEPDSDQLFAYAPQDVRAWRGVPPETQPAVCELVHGMAKLVDLDHHSQQLWLAGNGVVPLQAAVAYRVLAARLADHIDRSGA